MRNCESKRIDLPKQASRTSSPARATIQNKHPHGVTKTASNTEVSRSPHQTIVLRSTILIIATDCVFVVFVLATVAMAQSVNLKYPLTQTLTLRIAETGFVVKI